MQACPFIHKVTDHSNDSPIEQSSLPMKCPMASKENTISKNADEILLEIETDQIGDIPSLKEYKQLKKVMTMITTFYRDGSELKKKNFESMSEEIKKLETDEAMLEAQWKALSSKSYFLNHPKQKEYKKDLENEKAMMKKQKNEFLEKQKQFYELFEWSKTIVKVCEWLESALDDYCRQHLQFPEKLKQKLKEAPAFPTSEEQAKLYLKGLDEVTYNLQESQDFFRASVDGRLSRYHRIEAEIIESQLQVLSQFPENNTRRTYIENELKQDLEYVQKNAEETPESKRRREKMLKNHSEFLKVLLYHKQKLREMGIYLEQERTYDPRYDHYHD